MSACCWRDIELQNEGMTPTNLSGALLGSANSSDCQSGFAAKLFFQFQITELDHGGAAVRAAIRQFAAQQIFD